MFRCLIEGNDDCVVQMFSEMANWQLFLIFSGYYRATLVPYGISFCVQICRASDDSDIYNDGKASSVEKPVEFLISLVPTEPEIDEAEKNLLAIRLI
ncbi:hypothetical protein V6N13_013965 [Hibiscus sabdariffa]|uniref:Uncharacterized protein n=1 Tax=Hibiscus sabdariffa TaxID=183260 RepID=A0ABR2RU47_9ROSI